MAETKVRRKLAAILSADVVGYSKLMVDDEAATVDTLRQYRTAVGLVIDRHEGRIINAPGDNILAEFASAVEAVQATVEIQESIEGRNVELSDDRRMRFRIGLNLGDVIEEYDGTIYGDGVNIAARMEALAEEGGICISSAIHDAVEGKLDYGFDFLGEQQVKNIAKPVRVYRVSSEPGEKPPKIRDTRTNKRPLALASAVLVAAFAGALIWWNASEPPSEDTQIIATDSVLALPSGPSIAVLPFENMSGDAEQDYFADGITEDIISALSRFRSMFVIGKDSTIRYKGSQASAKDIGGELGVEFVLQGSIRRAGKVIRVSTQLVNARDGAVAWSNVFDRPLTAENVFAIQDDITEQVGV